MPSLFDPITLGAVEAPNRIIMAPLTRGRADRDAVPSDIMVEYYTQRASAGLIISEATGISREGLGWPFAPGLWTDAQVAAWKPVTDSVHAAGGRIVAQLWHMGRQGHSSVYETQPVSSSATATEGQAHTFEGKKDFEVARPLETNEIPRLLADYELATKNALAAGFDGVQIHAANGYLIDQFLRDNANFRTDEYGGSIENRVRLLREVAERVISVAGADRVSVRLSPNGDSQGVDDSNPEALFTAAAKAHVRQDRRPEAQPGDPQGLQRRPGRELGLHDRRGGAGRARFGQCRRDHLRPYVHSEPGPPRAPAHRRAAREGRCEDVVQPGPRGLHRLPRARNRERLSLIFPRKGDVAGASLTEGEARETQVPCPPLRHLRRHLP
jgi:hypothetical protein